ncbi:MAG: SDR family NAD(P)-dependent oxidoreductase, partial [Novosphingobium sp.]|nr:SDR family NAD(P)-dependent oxidoreductase [Novosphingobium sp.]
MAMYPDLKGKVAIVTGAGRHKGLGEAIARKLAEDGARLVIHDLGRPEGDMAPAHGVGASSELAEVAESIRAVNPHVSTFESDMREESQVEALVA